MAWLMAHGLRSRSWLIEKLADGFDVHHIDGNHDNNAPQNLVLIEHRDHMMLHGMQARLSRLEISRLGVEGRMKKLSPRKRQQIARKAGRASARARRNKPSTGTF